MAREDIHGAADGAGKTGNFTLFGGGKPLPDKYRFLLFDEKREVELVWNGKTNEVCNVVLPFQDGIIHDLIFFYGKSTKPIWNPILQPADKEYIDTFFDQYDSERGERYQRLSLSAGGLSGEGYRYEYKGVDTLWRCPIETLRKHDEQGRLHWPKKQGGVPRLKKYESEHEGVSLQDIWTDISKISSYAKLILYVLPISGKICESESHKLSNEV